MRRIPVRTRFSSKRLISSSLDIPPPYKKRQLFGSRLERGGLLLGHAVEGAEAPDQVDGVDADDFAGGEKLAQDLQRYTVVGVVEGGHQDQAVGYVEVGVAGGESLVAEDYGARERKFDDGELFAAEGAGGF